MPTTFTQAPILKGGQVSNILGLPKAPIFSRATFSAGANFSGAEFDGDLRATGLGEVAVEDLDARSPEVGNAPSVWPDGWALKSHSDGSAYLALKRNRAQKKSQ